MDVVALDVNSRDLAENAKNLLRQNILPLEYYGSGVENKSLQVDYEAFRKAFRKAGFNTVVEISIDGKEKMNVLIHEVQTHPATDRFMHVELINVRMDEEVHTQVPLEFTGMSPAVKDMGGTLISHLSEIEVKCLPKDLIHSLEVSIESLIDFNASIHVKDLIVPSAFTVLNDPEELVAAVSAPREEEAEEPTEESGEAGEGSQSGSAEGKSEGVEGSGE